MQEGETSIIILGATGDLARSKLLPALLDLHCAGRLPEHYTIIGFARQDLSADEFQQLVREAIAQKAHRHPQEEVARFLSRCAYVCGLFDAPEHYERLAQYLYERDRAAGTCTNKLFYLSVPPRFYDTILENLADSGLSVGCTGAHPGWTRLVVEKPFGENLESAQALDRKLALLYAEEQIFRMDHYLGKAALENILAFRFANMLFEPVWNNRYVERIEVRMLETRGMDGRGSFFEGVGQLRDVGQNHLLQMLALVTMDDPGELSAEAARARRAELLDALRLKAGGACVKGQYRGYRDEPEVADDSSVETYFKIDAEIANERWEGVPVTLESGKKLDVDLTEITVVFREEDSCVCSSSDSAVRQNIVRFRIQPDPLIGMRMWIKKPGYDMDIEAREIELPFMQNPALRMHDAYEKLLLDAIEGNQTLFTASEEVQSEWRFIMPIFERWEGEEPLFYEDGTRP